MTAFLHELTPYKVVLTIFFIFAWTRVVSRYSKGFTRLPGLVVWTVIWGTGLYLVYLPSKADIMAKLLGETNGANAVFTISIILLFYSVYRIYSKIEGLTQDINKLNQASSIAYSNLEKSSAKKQRDSGMPTSPLR